MTYNVSKCLLELHLTGIPLDNTFNDLLDLVISDEFVYNKDELWFIIEDYIWLNFSKSINVEEIVSNTYNIISTFYKRLEDELLNIYGIDTIIDEFNDKLDLFVIIKDLQVYKRLNHYTIIIYYEEYGK